MPAPEAKDSLESLPFNAAKGGVRVSLRVQPGAGRNGIDGVAAGAEGSPVLKLRVTAVPEGGKANAAVVKILAKAWKVPKSSIVITAGANNRNKTVLIAGDPGALMRRLREWQAGIGI